MATANLAKRTVDALEFQPGCDYCVWDTKLKGFGIRVIEWVDDKGIVGRRKVFIVRYRATGSRQVKRLNLGEVRALSEEWRVMYNTERPHHSLGDAPPSIYLPRITNPEKSHYELCA